MMRALLQGAAGGGGSGSGQRSTQEHLHYKKTEVVYSYVFNQDASCIAVGTSRGYSIYNCEPFRPWLHESIGGIAIVEMLYCTSLLALVGAGDQEGFSPRCLKIWNTKRQASLYDMGFVSKILAVRLNRRRLVVCLEKSLYIFDLETMRKLQDMDVHYNPKGIIALSPREEPSYLAYPAIEEGVVILHDAINLRMANKVVAHRNRLAAMAFSLDGSLLATASEQGTVIRVFTVPTMERMYMLRRGRSPCIIYSLAFNHAATRLAVSSDKNTVHVFQLSQGAIDSGNSPSRGGRDGSGEGGGGGGGHHSRRGSSSSSIGGIAGNMNGHQHGGGGSSSTTTGIGNAFSPSTPPTFGESASHLMNSVLPRRLSDVVEGARSFAQARLRDGGGGHHVCALIPSRTGGGQAGEERETLVVLTAEGHFFQFCIDVAQGGVCRLLEEKTLLQEDAGVQALQPRFLNPGSGNSGTEGMFSQSPSSSSSLIASAASVASSPSHSSTTPR